MTELSKNFAGAALGFLYVPEVPGLREGVAVHISNSGDYLEPVATMLVRSGVISQELAKWLKSNIDEGLQAIIDSYSLVYAVKIGEEVSIYSRTKRQKLPEPVADKLMRYLRVSEDTPAGWYSKTDGSPVFSSVGETIFGERDRRESPRREGTPYHHGKKRLLRWSGSGDIDAASKIVDRYLS